MKKGAIFTSRWLRRQFRQREVSPRPPRFESLESRLLLSGTPFPVGAEFQLNTYTISSQSTASTAIHSDGSFVTVWESSGQDGSGFGIFGRQYSASGTPLGAEFLINTYTTSDQFNPSVAMDSIGNFVVTWESLNQDGSDRGVYAQRYSGAGVPQGSEFLVNSDTAGAQRNSTVAMDADGDFVIAWESAAGDGNLFGIFAQRFNASGDPQGSQSLVNSYTTNSQINPSVAMDPAGNYVVVWDGEGAGDTGGIFGQRCDSSGVPQGSEFKVNTYTTSAQNTPDIAIDGSGNFVVAWRNSGQNGIYAQRYDAAGSPLSGEFRVVPATVTTATDPAVAMDPSGNFVIAWSGGGQGDSSGIHGQSFDSAGQARGSEFLVNSYTTSSQSLPSISLNAGGNLIVAWYSNSQDGSGNGVYAQRLVLEATAGRILAVNNDRGLPIAEGSSQIANFSGIAITFFEEMATSGPGSVLDLANWQLLRGVEDITDQIDTITQTFDSATNTWRVKLQLQENLPTGPITLTARHSLENLNGEGLDVNGDGVPGEDFVRSFTVTPPIPVGPEFRINTNTSDSGLTSYVHRDASGNSVVVWTRQVSGEYEAYAQRYDAGGTANGVPIFLVGSLEEPSVAITDSGYFVIVEKGISGITARIFNAAGVAIAAPVVGAGENPHVATDAMGNIVVVWQKSSGDGGGYGVFARRVSNTGALLGSQFLVNTYTTGNQINPFVAMEGDGDFVVSWLSANQDGSGDGIYAQRFDAAGGVLGSEFRVNVTTSGQQRFPSSAIDPAGNLTIAWSGSGPGDSTGVFARRYDSSGTPVGTEFLVNTYTTGTQQSPSVVSDLYGNFIITWTGEGEGDTSGVFLRRYGSDGLPRETGFRLNSYTTGTQDEPGVAIDAQGNFIAVWSGAGPGVSEGVFAQQYSVIEYLRGGPYVITEGDPLTLMATDLVTNPLQSYSWDINGDDVFGDAFGQEPTLSWAQLAALGLDGPSIYAVRVRVTDPDNGEYRTLATSLTVNNANPTIAIQGDVQIEVGDTYTLDLGAISEPGLDTVTQWVVYWGDFRISPYATPGEATHVYMKSGFYDIIVDLIDEDGTHHAGALTVNVTDSTHTISLTSPLNVNQTPIFSTVDLVGEFNGQLMFYLDPPDSPLSTGELYLTQPGMPSALVKYDYHLRINSSDIAELNGRFIHPILSSDGAELAVSENGVTTQILDIYPGVTHYPTPYPPYYRTEINNGRPGNFYRSGSQVYFWASSATGRDIWVTDGTTAGTLKVYDLASSPEDDSLTIVDGVAYWTARNAAGAGASQLSLPTTSDPILSTIGPDGGVYLLLKASAGDRWNLYHQVGATATLIHTSIVSDDADLITSGGYVYYTVGNTLYRANSTAGFEVLYTSPAGKTLNHLASLAGNVYFLESQNPEQTVWTLRDSAGLQLATNVVLGRESRDPLASVAGRLFFAVKNPFYGDELWTSQGTPATTEVFLGTRVGSIVNDPGHLFAGTTKFFFEADDGVQGYGLFESDGTVAGTRRVHTTSLDRDSGSNPSQVVNYNGKIVFDAMDGITASRQLFISDGTLAGTEAIPGTTRAIGKQAVLGDKVVYVKTVVASGTVKYQLWAWNGSTNTLLADNLPTLTVNTTLSQVGARLLLVDPSFTKFWVTDGTPGGTSSVVDSIDEFVAADSYAYYISSGLYRYDSVSATTLKVTTARPVDGSIRTVGNTAYFVVKTGNVSTLWKSDGSVAGTVPLHTLAGPFGTAVVFNNEYYFTLDSGGSSVVGLFKLDASSGEIIPLFSHEDIEPNLTTGFASGGKLRIFAAGKSNGPGYLLESDGTAAGTFVVGSVDDFPLQSPIVVGDLAYYILYRNSDYEIIVSDGTPAGTYSLPDSSLYHNRSSFPKVLGGYLGKLVYSADDGAIGNEIRFFDPTVQPVIIGEETHINEGDSASFDVSSSFDPVLGGPLTFEWDLNRDGFYDDATGATVNVTWSQLLEMGDFDSFGLDSVGYVPVRARTADGRFAYGGVKLFVHDTAPTVRMLTSPEVRRDIAASLKFAGNEPSDSDRAENVTYEFDWNNDGSYDQSIVAKNVVIVSHIFETAGTHTVNIRATDLDGAMSPVASFSINVLGYAITSGTLDWYATTGDDVVHFEQIDATTVRVIETKLKGVTVSNQYDVTGISGFVNANGREGNDTLDGSLLTTKAAQLYGGDGNDFVYGGAVADSMEGGLGNDTLWGGLGNDSIIGDDGTDLVYGDYPEGDGRVLSKTSLGADTINGGAGNDTIYGDGDGGEGVADSIYGDSGDDTIFADGSEGAIGVAGDTIDGGLDNDTITADGGEGSPDTILGSAGDDFINTGGGNDLADGGTGNDILLGGVSSGGAIDTLSGGDGRDILVGDGGIAKPSNKVGGIDVLNGGAGQDLVITGFVDTTSITSFDWLAIRQEWVSGSSLASRRDHLQGVGTGLNGTSVLVLGAIVFNDKPLDGPALVDVVLGGTEEDWLLLDASEEIAGDLEVGDLMDDLSLFPRAS